MLVRGSASRPNCSATVISEPVKPIAKSANSHFHSFSVPGTSLSKGRLPGWETHSTSEVISPFRLPFLLPMNFLVEMLKNRSTPSLWEELVRKRMGQNGHG